MDTFSIPFRFTTSGTAAKHAEGSDSYYIHILSNVIQIEPNELPLEPNFGTSDLTFEKINTASLIEIAAKYVPELRIDNISAIVDDDGNEKILISYAL